MESYCRNSRTENSVRTFQTCWSWETFSIPLQIH